ncbi:hypothetical protein OG705_28905 [Streptomyces sp. NBC_00838]|uniref:hypothetical protein n=1 Tax=Streptomyces sp. NBC_00838 TaxID=2903680 RepID=UPI003863FD81|nr:hypothetical protein OG705_28905 [Streptomyces sp. NBC_00838]
MNLTKPYVYGRSVVKSMLSRTEDNVGPPTERSEGEPTVREQLTYARIVIADILLDLDAGGVKERDALFLLRTIEGICAQVLGVQVVEIEDASASARGRASVPIVEGAGHPAHRLAGRRDAGLDAAERASGFRRLPGRVVPDRVAGGLSNMENLVFESPPPPRKANPDNDAIADKLRKRHGEWAKVGAFTNAETTAANIRRGRPKAFEPSGAFEAVSRKVGDETFLYVRYVGDSSTDNDDTEKQKG